MKKKSTSNWKSKTIFKPEDTAPRKASLCVILNTTFLGLKRCSRQEAPVTNSGFQELLQFMFWRYFVRDCPALPAAEQHGEPHCRDTQVGKPTPRRSWDCSHLHKKQFFPCHFHAAPTPLQLLHRTTVKLNLLCFFLNEIRL